MGYNSIDSLSKALDAWYDGEATSAQEEMLRAYFAATPASEVPENMRSAAVMFRGFAMAAAEEYTPAAAEPRKRNVVFRIAALATGVAAAVALFVVGITSQQETAVEEFYGYYADGTPITDLDDAGAQLGSLAMLSELESSIDIAQMLSGIIDTETE